MKPGVLVSFVCALVGLALWLVPEKRAGDPLLQGGATKNRDASSAHVSAVTEPAEARVRGRERPAQPTAAQKWLRNLLSQLPSVKGPKGLDMAAMNRFRAKLDSLDTDEILDVLRELDASDVTPGDRRQLAGFIVGSLARRDPRLALDEFVGRISDNPAGSMNQLGFIYQKWAFTDAAAAASWFEQQLSKGTLAVATGRNGVTVDPRTQFESLLLRAQAARDPSAAATRWASMAESARAEALNDDWFSRLSPERVKAVAGFLREQSEDAPAMLATASSMRIRQGDLKDAGEFLKVLEPTSEERPAIVAEALRCRVVGQDELRVTPQEAQAWILQQVPQDADRLTGTVLGQFVEWHDFSEMSRLALDYRDGSGSDDVLVAFLKSAPESSRSEILKLAAEISDPALREEVTARFIK